MRRPIRFALSLILLLWALVACAPVRSAEPEPELKQESGVAWRSVSFSGESSGPLFTRARFFYERFQYQEARRLLEADLAAHPENAEARRLLSMCRVLLGEARTGLPAEIGCGGHQLRQRRKAAELSELIGASEALSARGDRDGAREKAALVLESLRWYPFRLENHDELQKRARAVLTTVGP